MSELKEHLFCECDECIREYRGPLSNEMRPYYLKSEADKVIAELKEERRWRKCSEEKPPHSGIYLVCIAGHVRTLDTFDSDRNLWRNYNSTHWMPLPSAPKEENK